MKAKEVCGRVQTRGGRDAAIAWDKHRPDGLSAEDWRQYNGDGTTDALVTPHKQYLRLGRDSEAQGPACRVLFKSQYAQCIAPDVFRFVRRVS